MADHPNAQIARAGMDAFNRGDVEAFAATVADDVVWHAPGTNRFSGEFRGKAAALTRFKEQAQAGVGFSFTDVHDVVANDEHVVALLYIRVTGPGGEYTGPSVFVQHLREGKLVEFWAMNEDQAAIDRVVDG
jgi:ketosteroid isomerase-like protein